MKLLVIMNQGAGALAGKNCQETSLRIAHSFKEAGVEAFVHSVEARRVSEHAKEGLESEVDAIIAAGGDGTVSMVANVVAASHKAMGVLPLGVHNHFAQALKLPFDLEGAILAMSRAKAIDLPVPEVNGRLFLNYSAVGLNSGGRSGSSHSTLAALRRLIGLPDDDLKLRARGHTLASTTSLIVCNNPHQVKSMGIDPSPAPEGGLFNVYVASRRHKHARIFHVMAMSDARVDSRFKHLPVCIDGETVDMHPPLMYRIRPRPMKVLVPSTDASS